MQILLRKRIHFRAAGYVIILFQLQTLYGIKWDYKMVKNYNKALFLLSVLGGGDGDKASVARSMASIQSGYFQNTNMAS